ncbi:MAG: hypothetical protein NT013_30505 [Planctomycetia bacterium]|nr:hypothetical protein [Planctomycetia bacterium]
MRSVTTILVLMGAAFLSAAWSQTTSGEDPPAKPVEPRKLEIKVDGKELSIGGKKVPMPGERKTLIELLGKPSRIVEKANTLIVWDELGLLAYELPNGDSIITFAVALGDLSFQMPDFWPKKVFKGKLLLDGVAVTADTTIDAINRDKKGTLLKSGSVGSWIRYDEVNVGIVKGKNGYFDEKNGTLAELYIESTRRRP